MVSFFCVKNEIYNSYILRVMVNLTQLLKFLNVKQDEYVKLSVDDDTSPTREATTVETGSLIEGSLYHCYLYATDSKFKEILFPDDQETYISDWIETVVKKCFTNQSVKSEMKARRIVPIENLIRDIRIEEASHRVFLFLAVLSKSHILVINSDKLDLFSYQDEHPKGTESNFIVLYKTDKDYSLYVGDFKQEWKSRWCLITKS